MSDVTAAAALPRWEENRDRARRFVTKWDGESRERAEKDSFWNDLLDVFGVDRRQVARFEAVAKRYSTGGNGFIDLFWPGRLLGAWVRKVDSADHGAGRPVVGSRDRGRRRFRRNVWFSAGGACRRAAVSPEGLLVPPSGDREGSEATDADLAVELAHVVARGEQQPLVTRGVVSA